MKSSRGIFILVGLALLPIARAAEIPLTDLSRLDLKKTLASTTDYHGTPALKVVEKDAGPAEALAIVKNTSFRNGTIQVDVAGAIAKSAIEGARGFIGVAFHVQADAARFELLYIRPTNGRADDQLRRNHSTQYVSFPDWPWERLRKESPGVYESYTDLVTGEWTHLRIAVEGTNASLFVGEATQPCLIVHDLKLGDTEGAVALWIGPGTEGYFRNLSVSRE
jgi:hypothetical protein